MVEVATMLDAPVRRVTLLEDRAQVTREGKVWLGAGRQRVRVEHVAPVIGDRTLVVRASDGTRIDDAFVRREWLIGPGARPPEAQPIVDEFRRVAAALAEAQALHQLLEADRAGAEQAVEVVLEAVNRELPHAEAWAPHWASDLEQVLADARAAGTALWTSEGALEELRLRLATVLAHAATGWRVDYELAAEVVIDVTVATAGEHALTLDYVVPCALWRPIHRASLGPVADGAGQVTFSLEAALWQATGEDWTDVELSFSTARPTQRAEPPLLADDRLRVQKKVDKRVVVEVREQAIEALGEGGTAVADELQGVDDGGEVRLLRATTRANVKADGRLQRVPVGRFEAAAEIERVARPERSPLVHLSSRQANGAAYPLLAGPVELLRQAEPDGPVEYVGTGELGFVAPGERFLLGWGGDEALRIGRKTHETREVGRISGKQTITRTVELFLSNLADLPASFRLEERVPVSELAEVVIDIDSKETRPLSRPDEHGIVAWPVVLAPLGTTEVKLVYTLVASSDVVL